MSSNEPSGKLQALRVHDVIAGAQAGRGGPIRRLLDRDIRDVDADDLAGAAAEARAHRRLAAAELEHARALRVLADERLVEDPAVVQDGVGAGDAVAPVVAERGVMELALARLLRFNHVSLHIVTSPQRRAPGDRIA